MSLEKEVDNLENINTMELNYKPYCPGCKRKREVMRWGNPFKMTDHEGNEEAWQKLSCWGCEIIFACRIAVKRNN